MANGKKKAKQGKKKAEAAKDGTAKCKLPLVCAYLEKVAPPSGATPPASGPWFTDVQSCIQDLVTAVMYLERNIHFNDTAKTGPTFSVFYGPAGPGRNPPPPPPAYP
jgi:hypothetical protein